MRRAIFAVVVLVGGCLSPSTAQRGHPLYPAVTPLPPLDQVARLSIVLQGTMSPAQGVTAFIKSVDGREVDAHDNAFELQPGCHVVEIENRIFNYRTPRPGGSAPDYGQLIFPIRMRAGHAYEIVVRYETSPGLRFRVTSYGVEKDPSGAHVQIIADATSAGTVEACHAWTPPPA